MKKDFERVQAVVTKAEKKKIEQHARKDGRTVSNLIKMLLIKAKVL